MVARLTPMASRTALVAHQSCTFALCSPEIIETCKETPENTHSNQGDFFIPANKNFFKSWEEYSPVEQ